MIAEVVVSVMILVFAVIFLRTSFLEFYLPQPGFIGFISSPNFYPIFFSIILIILCTILLIKSITPIVKKKRIEWKISIDVFSMKRIAIILISTALYIYCFDKVSFFISTLLYLSILILYLNPQLKYKALLYIVLGSFIVAIIFPEIFKIMVPVR
jgi:hypothetical protein